MLGDEDIVDIQYLNNHRLNKSQIVKKLDLHRQTVSKYLEDPEAVEIGSRSSIVYPYNDHLTKRLNDFEDLNATRLARNIRTLNSPDARPQASAG